MLYLPCGDGHSMFDTGGWAFWTSVGTPGHHPSFELALMQQLFGCVRCTRQWHHALQRHALSDGPAARMAQLAVVSR